jgi:hypothetical protein
MNNLNAVLILTAIGTALSGGHIFLAVPAAFVVVLFGELIRHQKPVPPEKIGTGDAGRKILAAFFIGGTVGAIAGFQPLLAASLAAAGRVLWALIQNFDHA